jgi:protein-tyrosine phosphatase
MLEALLRERLPDCAISSAGIGAMIGHPADPHAVTLMQSRGIDISGHRARQLVERNCREVDLILVMEHDHRHAVERSFPFTRGRVYRIGHHSDIEVSDPYGRGASAFDDALSLIETGVADWVQLIRKLAPTP